MERRCKHCHSLCGPSDLRCGSCGSGNIEGPPPVAPILPAPSAPRRWFWLKFWHLLVLLPLLAALLMVVTSFQCCAGCLVASTTVGASRGTTAAPPPPSTMGNEATGGEAAPVLAPEALAPGPLRVAADPDSPPFLTQDAQGYAGFEYGVMLAIAGELGRELQVVPTDYADLPAAVRDGGADVAIGQMPPIVRNGLRNSSPYLEFTLCLVTRPGSDIESSAQLPGRRVASFDDAVARRTVFELASTPPVVIEDRVYADMLASGEIDAMVNDCPLARHDAKKDPRRLRVVSSGLASSSYVVVSRADDAALARSIDQVLTDLGERGLLEQLEKRWLE